MAHVVNVESVMALVDGATLTGPATFKPVLTAGSANAELSLLIGSTEFFNLKALAATSADSGCIHIGGGVTMVVALTGTGAKAWGLAEID